VVVVKKSHVGIIPSDPFCYNIAMDDKEKVLRFMRGQLMGVVATINSNANKPESATVAFSETENLEIIFGTFNTTRKYRNLKNNANVSFVITLDNVTVQYEGIASGLSGKDLEDARNIHLAKNPGSHKYAFNPIQAFVKVSPSWLRYSDLSRDPEEIFEINF
jgi:uncharacterized pyridoxamine 5'-phosphate oxidase family protein